MKPQPQSIQCYLLSDLGLSEATREAISESGSLTFGHANHTLYLAETIGLVIHESLTSEDRRILESLGGDAYIDLEN